MLVIGIAGKKRSGKDTVAKLIMACAERAGIKATRRALADTLKEECARMIAIELESGFEPDQLLTFKRVLQEMHDDITKEKYRLLLQWWGTEFRRGMVSDSYWVDKLRDWLLQHKSHLQQEIFVVPDVRFPNEIKMIKQQGGLIINVYRPEIEGSDGHASEHALNGMMGGWFYTIDNNGDLDMLQHTVERLFPMISDWAWGGVSQ